LAVSESLLRDDINHDENITTTESNPSTQRNKSKMKNSKMTITKTAYVSCALSCSSDGSVIISPSCEAIVKAPSLVGKVLNGSDINTSSPQYVDEISVLNYEIILNCSCNNVIGLLSIDYCNTIETDNNISMNHNTSSVGSHIGYIKGDIGMRISPNLTYKNSELNSGFNTRDIKPINSNVKAYTLNSTVKHNDNKAIPPLNKSMLCSDVITVNIKRDSEDNLYDKYSLVAYGNSCGIVRIHTIRL
jgi:hypothetical protein